MVMKAMYKIFFKKRSQLDKTLKCQDLNQKFGNSFLKFIDFFFGLIFVKFISRFIDEIVDVFLIFRKNYEIQSNCNARKIFAFD